MNLKPRFSLLTLLILTAFFAGGVKLWYGPHHVMEKVSSTQENEYTFTRDWRGTRIIQGPYIKRLHEEKGWVTDIEFYRAGHVLSSYYVLRTFDPMVDERDQPLKFPDRLGLTPDEQQVWQAAIDREDARLATPNHHPSGNWWFNVLTE